MNACLKGTIEKTWRAIVALGVLASCTGPLRAEIHSDFDAGGTYFGGTEGWFNYAGLPDFSTATPTGGSTQWLRVKPNQYYGQITSQNWAVPDITISDWNSNSHLKFDVLVDDLWIPNNANQSFSVEFQVGGGVNPTSTQYANTTINTSLKNVVQSVSIPLASLQPFDPTATFWNLSINLSPGYAWEWDSNNPSVQPYDARFYVDISAGFPNPPPAHCSPFAEQSSPRSFGVDELS